MAEHLTLEQAFNADAASQRTGIALMLWLHANIGLNPIF